MNRRGFLSILGGAAAAATLDPEKLLWVPGKKKIFIPKLAPEPAFKSGVAIAYYARELERFGTVAACGSYQQEYNRALSLHAESLESQIKARLGFYDAMIGGGDTGEMSGVRLMAMWRKGDAR